MRTTLKFFHLPDQSCLFSDLVEHRLIQACQEFNIYRAHRVSLPPIPGATSQPLFNSIL